MRSLLLLFALPLFATVNEPLRIELFSGYRNDRIHWHTQTAAYNELLRNVQFWMNGADLKAIYRDLAFCVRGSYSAFGSGESNRNGWAAEGDGYFGYAVNLTPNRTYKVILTPLVGYAAYWEELRRAPGPLHFTWNGFYFGGYFLIEPGNRLVLNAGYAYNLMHNHFRAQETDGAKVKSNTQGNPGQTGWLQFDYLLSRLWRIGLGADINYFSAHGQILKLRWTSIAGWLQISREL